MIRKIEEIPVTATSHPFVSARERCRLEENGYRETEYYMHGTANVYRTEADGSLGIRFADAPYVNRFVVRAPADPARCSGRVVVEIINPTSGMDIERMWIITHHHFMRRGDIYIGITSKPNTVEKLKEFDPERYGRLDWSNPTPDDPLPHQDKNPTILSDYKGYYETGLFWDMLTDLAHAVRDRSAVSPVREYACRQIILTGWSQSACYMTRYLRSFAYRPEVKRDGCVFDGYLSGAAPRSFPIPMNQYESHDVKDSQESRVSYAEQPYLVVQTESENAEFAGYLTTKADSDCPNFPYRVHEYAGPSHDTMQSSIHYYGDDPDLARIGMVRTYTGKHDRGNDYPYHFLFAASYEQLYRWMDSGVAPASCPRIKTDGMGNNLRDALGNSIGGVRTCLVDYPTAAYYYYSSIEPGQSFVDPSSDRDILHGHERGFPAPMLRFMYGTLDNYRKLVAENTKEHVLKGYVLEDDAGELVELAVRLAAERGLE